MTEVAIWDRMHWAHMQLAVARYDHAAAATEDFIVFAGGVDECDSTRCFCFFFTFLGFVATCI